jgi:rare lipoprotein A
MDDATIDSCMAVRQTTTWPTGIRVAWHLLRKSRMTRWLPSLGLILALGAFRPMSPDIETTPHRGRVQLGSATYLARSFHGNESASGETFDERKLIAAHRTLPFGSQVRVTNLENGRSVKVRIVDRGPYGRNYRRGTIIDLSRAAARRLRMIRQGKVPVRVVVLKVGSNRRWRSR